MLRPTLLDFSRRERQIMDILYRLGRATAAQVLAEMPGRPSYSTVRTQLRVLERKGHVRHEVVGLRYVYSPVVSREKAQQFALRHLVETFFGGSAEDAVAALLTGVGPRIRREGLERLSSLIEKAQRLGVKS